MPRISVAPDPGPDAAATPLRQLSDGAAWAEPKSPGRDARRTERLFSVQTNLDHCVKAARQVAGELASLQSEMKMIMADHQHPVKGVVRDAALDCGVQSVDDWAAKTTSVPGSIPGSMDSGAIHPPSLDPPRLPRSGCTPLGDDVVRGRSSRRTSANSLHVPPITPAGFPEVRPHDDGSFGATEKPPRASWNSVISASAQSAVYASQFRQRRVGAVRSSEGAQIFADEEAMKDKLRNDLTEDGDSKYYKEDGFCAGVVRSSWFETSTMALIALNALWIAIDIDNNDAPTLFEADAIYQVVGNAFCVLFLLELLVRLGALKKWAYCLKEPWIIFDICLVFLMVCETWVIALVMALLGSGSSGAAGNLKAFVVFRMMRLLRVLRLARVLRELSELMVIMKAMAIAFRAISVVLGLLGIIIYTFGIVFRVLLEESEVGVQHFKSIPGAMGTLLIEMTLSGARGGALIKQANQESVLYSAILLLFVLLANITVMGVLGGLLVQTVKTVAELEKEERLVKKMGGMIDELWDHCFCRDSLVEKKPGIVGEEPTTVINETHLRRLLSDEEAQRLLSKNGVDLDGLVDISTFIFEQSDGVLTKAQFKRIVLDLRGKNTAKVKDHVETRRFMNALMRRVQRGSVVS